MDTLVSNIGASAASEIFSSMNLDMGTFTGYSGEDF